MYEKTTITFFIFILSLMFQGKAHSVPTKWQRIEVSLSNLINSGWQVKEFSTHRAAYIYPFNSSSFSESSYVLFLTKDGKNIICTVINPTAPQSDSTCTLIN